jgi:hypothetical protein
VVVLVPKVYDAEDLGGLGVPYHHHVVLGVVGLDGHTEVVAWLVFVSHLKRVPRVRSETKISTAFSSSTAIPSNRGG